MPVALPATRHLRTDRLLLRPIADDDLDILHAILSDAETMRHWSTPPHTERQQSAEWIADNRAAMAAGTAIEYGVEFQGRLIGRATFWNGNELGYIFDQAYWGQGFASEAVAALIDHGFAIRDWTEIIADIDPRNLGSLRLAERLGFRRSGFEKDTYCVDGRWSDSLYCTLDRAAWLSR